MRYNSYFTRGRKCNSRLSQNENFLLFCATKVNVPCGWEVEKLILSFSSATEHRNTRLMITHGGSVSGQEAAHFGVPVVAIPVFGEQQLRAERTQRDDFGVMLEVRNVTRESLLWAMDEAMNNPR
jgi:UDP:flavonoid glycosyltransferase YjiC (YdhE family)